MAGITLDFIYITHKNDIRYLDFIHDLHLDKSPMGIDTETTGLDVFTLDLILLSVSVNNHIYIFNCILLGDSFTKEIVHQLQLSERKAIMHNAKYDLKVLLRLFGILLTNVHDTMWTETMLNAGIGITFYALSDLVAKYTGVILNKDVRESFYKDFSKEKELTQEQIVYAAMDVAFLEEVYKAQLQQVLDSKEEKVYELESRLVPVVAAMELTGILLDKEAWSALAKTNEEGYFKAKKDLHEYLLSLLTFSGYESAFKAFESLKIPVKRKRGKEALSLITGETGIKEAVSNSINWGSHSQLLRVVNLLGLNVDSTNEKTIKDHKNDFEFVQKILDFRELEKLNSTYGFSFLEHIHPVTGRIHSELNNIGAATGRFSSGGHNSPNLQNIPRASKYRSCFIAPEGKLLLSTDYSQQEFRLAGAVSGEPAIINAYKIGKDMHTMTAAIVLNKPLNEITKEERNDGKTVNFAILYGSTEYGLAYNRKIGIDQAKKILNDFYAGYPSLARFKKVVEEFILQRKYSITPLGRRRYFADTAVFASPEEVQKARERMKREGFNHIIQGGGADITKLALVELFFRNPFGEKFLLVLQVHDEILAEIDESIKDEAKEFMEKIMCEVEQQFLGEIPAVVESKLDKVWSH